MTPGHERVRDAVQTRMDELGLVQRSLASKAGVDTGTVSNLLTGKTWPQVRSRARIEAALNWPIGTLAQIRAGGSPPPEDPTPDGTDPVEDTIRDIPHLLAEDIDLFIGVYRIRRDEHTKRRLADLEEMKAGLGYIEDPEVRATIEHQFQQQIDVLRRAGYEPLRDETDS